MKNTVKKNHTYKKKFIDNEKSIPHFKFAPLDYSCSGVYLQNCKTTENLTLLATSLFSSKVGLSKIFESDLDL